MDLSAVVFDEKGLVQAIAQDVDTGEVLMVGFMNAESLRLSLESGRVTYWSRSRKELWVKGGTSGNVQQIEELRIDCDGDALLFKVRQRGGACHAGYRSCFYRKCEDGTWVVDGDRVFDPKDAYG